MYSLGCRIKLKWALIIGLASVMFAFTAGLSGAEVLTVVYPAFPTSLDPHKALDSASWTYIHACYERLTTFKGRTTEAVPSLAVTWRISDDGLIYTFVLHQDHTFIDGRAVDAQAVKFSFDRAMETGVAAPEFFPEIEEVAVLGPYTVRFFLKRPSPFFPQALALAPASIVSPGVMDKPSDYLETSSLGSGQYLIDSMVPKKKIVLTLRPETETLLPIKRFEAIIEPAPDKELEMLLGGEVLAAGGLDPSQLKSLDNYYPVRASDNPGLTAELLLINCQAPWLDRIEVRQALGMAIDYQALRNRLFFGRASAASSGPVPVGMWGVQQSIRRFPVYDPDKARERLSESGPPDRRLLLIFDKSKEWRDQEISLLKHYFKELGLQLKIKALSRDDFIEAVHRKKFDLALGSIKPRTADPMEILRAWLGSDSDSSREIAGTCNVGWAGEYVNRPLPVRDKKRLVVQLGAIQEKLAREVPAVFLFQYGLNYGFSNRLENLEINPMTPEALPLAQIRFGPPRPLYEFAIAPWESGEDESN